MFLLCALPSCFFCPLMSFFGPLSGFSSSSFVQNGFFVSLSSSSLFSSPAKQAKTHKGLLFCTMSIPAPHVTHVFSHARLLSSSHPCFFLRLILAQSYLSVEVPCTFCLMNHNGPCGATNPRQHTGCVKGVYTAARHMSFFAEPVLSFLTNAPETNVIHVLASFLGKYTDPWTRTNCSSLSNLN